MAMLWKNVRKQLRLETLIGAMLLSQLQEFLP